MENTQQPFTPVCQHCENRIAEYVVETHGQFHFSCDECLPHISEFATFTKLTDAHLAIGARVADDWYADHMKMAELWAWLTEQGHAPDDPAYFMEKPYKWTPEARLFAVVVAIVNA